jgi:hypothetical protein
MASTIRLAASESFPDDWLNGLTVTIIAGTGVGESKTITDYAGATDTATVDSAWQASPDSTSKYEIKASRIGTGNYITITSAIGTVTKTVNLPPTWDKSNRISVDGFKLRGTITNVSSPNPAVITSPGHGLANGDKVAIAEVGGETAINSASSQVHTVSNVTSNTFTIPVNTTGGSSYTPGTGFWGDWEAK